MSKLQKTMTKRTRVICVLTVLAVLCCIFAVACQVTPAHTHDLKKTNAVAATCLTAGNKEYYACEGCGKYFEDAAGTKEIALTDTVIAALDHDIVHHEAKEATCSAPGYDAYDTCSRCDYTTKGEDIPATGTCEYSFVSDGEGSRYACKHCGATKGKVLTNEDSQFSVKDEDGYGLYRVEGERIRLKDWGFETVSDGQGTWQLEGTIPEHIQSLKMSMRIGLWLPYEQKTFGFGFTNETKRTTYKLVLRLFSASPTEIDFDEYYELKVNGEVVETNFKIPAVTMKYWDKRIWGRIVNGDPLLLEIPNVKMNEGGNRVEITVKKGFDNTAWQDPEKNYPGETVTPVVFDCFDVVTDNGAELKALESFDGTPTVTISENGTIRMEAESADVSALVTKKNAEGAALECYETLGRASGGKLVGRIDGGQMKFYIKVEKACTVTLNINMCNSSVAAGADKESRGIAVDTCVKYTLDGVKLTQDAYVMAADSWLVENHGYYYLNDSTIANGLKLSAGVHELVFDFEGIENPACFDYIDLVVSGIN